VKSRSLGALSLVAAITLSACSTTHFFVVGEPNRAGSAERASADSFGGAIEKTEVLECETNGVSEVRVKRGFFNSLLGAITLGGYQSTSIEYVCAKSEDDDIPVLGSPRTSGGGSDGE